jgi:hypothetical protein
MLRHRLRPLPLADLFDEGLEARGQRRVGLAIESHPAAKIKRFANRYKFGIIIIYGI